MGLFSSIFGDKTTVPEFKPVDYDEQTRKAVAGNRAIVGEAGLAAREAQAEDQATLEQGLRRAIKDYDALVTSERSVIGDMLEGNLPEAMRRRMQDRSVRLGMVGSQAGEAASAYDLGLTELDMVRMGMDYAARYKQQQAATGMAKASSVLGMFSTPQQRVAHQTSERNLQFQRDVYASKMAAAPDPVASGLFNTGMTFAGWSVGLQAAHLMGNAGQKPPASGLLGGVAGGMLGMAMGGPVGGFLGAEIGGHYGSGGDIFTDSLFTRPKGTDISGLGTKKLGKANWPPRAAANY